MERRTKRMKKTTPETFAKYPKRVYLFVIALLVFSIGFAANSYADKAKEIDMKVDETLKTFKATVKEAEDVMNRAKGLLVLPNVKKGALIVGGEYGRGALRIAGKTVDYYSMTTGSIGFQIGGEAKDIVIAYMSDEALQKFRDSKGWEAGVDGNVAFIKSGAGQKSVTSMAKEPIVAFVFGVKGLIADMSFKGAKFKKLDLTD